jgi:hypothetical protein
MAGLPAVVAVGAGEATDIPGITRPENGSFRCNFGLVEVAGENAEVTITLFDGSGVELGAASYSLGPFEPMQASLETLGSGIRVSGGRLHVAVTAGSGKVLAFASMVGNGAVSQDPSTLEMEVAGLGGITAIHAGDGLAGGGSGGEVTLSVMAGEGIEVGPDGVAIADGAITADNIAPGEVVTAVMADGTSIRGVVTIAGGENIHISRDGNTVEVATSSCAGERVETAITASLSTTTADQWVTSSDRLVIPSAGRWRVGYTLVQEIENLGLQTTTAPVNVALANLSDNQVLTSSMSLTGLTVNIGFGAEQVTTVTGEAVIDCDGGELIAAVARSSRADLQLTVHPADADLGVGLSGPIGASYIWAECVVME